MLLRGLDGMEGIVEVNEGEDANDDYGEERNRMGEKGG